MLFFKKDTQVYFLPCVLAFALHALLMLFLWVKPLFTPSEAAGSGIPHVIHATTVNAALLAAMMPKHPLPATASPLPPKKNPSKIQPPESTVNSLPAKKTSQLAKSLKTKQISEDFKKWLKKDIQNQLHQATRKEITEKMTEKKSPLSSKPVPDAASSVSASKGMSAKDSDEIDRYKNLILQSIRQVWIMPEQLPQTISCELMITLAPGGVVLSVDLIRSSGNAALDHSALQAVKKASPLPVPKDQTFDYFRTLHLTVKPDGSLQTEKDQ